MKSNWPKEKLGKIIIGIVISAFCVAFYIAKQYLFSFLTLILLIILIKSETLTKLVFNKLGFEAEFRIPEEKIKKDIKDNNKPINKDTFALFKNVEEQVLRDVHRKIGGEMKRQIHLVYGFPDRPEFRYTPDAIIQTDKELIFVEIKYVLKPQFAQKIVESASRYLKMVLDKFSPAAGKKLVTKLILASNYDIDPKSFSVPEGINVEFYKL